MELFNSKSTPGSSKQDKIPCDSAIEESQLMVMQATGSRDTTGSRFTVIVPNFKPLLIWKSYQKLSNCKKLHLLCAWTIYLTKESVINSPVTQEMGVNLKFE